MSGHHSFDKLRNRMTPERRAYNAAKTEEFTLEITARFPKGSVTIAKFSEVGAQTDERPQRESTT